MDCGLEFTPVTNTSVEVDGGIFFVRPNRPKTIRTALSETEFQFCYVQMLAHMTITRCDLTAVSC